MQAPPPQDETESPSYLHLTQNFEPVKLSSTAIMCPPGTDQTMRSPQFWYFCAPEIKQGFNPQPDAPWSGSLSVSGMIFNGGNIFDAWSLLARPETPPRSRSAQCRSLGAFDVLSTEVLDIIVNSMEDKTDIVALGLCCEGFWRIIHRHILRSLTKAAALWAGTKIAFQGSYCYDLPKPFLEDGLLERIVPEEDFWRPWGRFREFFYAHADFDRPAGPEEVALAWREAMNGHKDGIKISSARWEKLQDDVSCSEMFPQDRTWVLRNLTTYEFVDSRRLEANNLKDGMKTKFEDILMSKICWTTYSSPEDEHSKLHRGVWAGHRFDIVTSEVHAQDDVEDEWGDITDVVSKQIKDLRTELHPPDNRRSALRRMR